MRCNCLVRGSKILQSSVDGDIMKSHPQLIEKQGKNEFVVLPIDEFKALTSLLKDYEDLKDLRDEKERSKHQKAIPLSKVIADLAL